LSRLTVRFDSIDLEFLWRFIQSICEAGKTEALFRAAPKSDRQEIEYIMSPPSNTVAFIGLGVMGYPMALNLRKGLDRSYTLLICDVFEDALSRFQKETEGEGPVQVIKSGYEAAQKAVRI
jgi:hypothetical protein